MKKYLIIAIAMFIAPFSTFAQYRTTTTVSSWGNTIDTRTTDPYGRTLGTSSSSVDYFGNMNTTYKDPYGNRTGSASTTTDYFGNTITTYKDPYGNKVGSASSSTDYFGNTTTTYKDPYGNKVGSASSSTDTGATPARPIKTVMATMSGPRRCGDGKKPETQVMPIKTITTKHHYLCWARSGRIHGWAF